MTNWFTLLLPVNKHRLVISPKGNVPSDTKLSNKPMKFLKALYKQNLLALIKWHWHVSHCCSQRCFSAVDYEFLATLEAVFFCFGSVRLIIQSGVAVWVMPPPDLGNKLTAGNCTWNNETTFPPGFTSIYWLFMRRGPLLPNLFPLFSMCLHSL